MSWTRWFRGGQSPAQKQQPTNRRTRHPWWLRATLLLEHLEDRLAPAIVAVSATHPTLISDTAAGNVNNPASVSQNGRYVVYSSVATDLVPGQTSTVIAQNVYLYDRTSGTNRLVSHASGSATTGGNAL